MDGPPNRPPGTDAADDEFIDTCIAVSAENLRKQTAGKNSQKIFSANRAAALF